MQHSSHESASRTSTRLGPAVWVSLGLVYVVWGSTYLGIRVVVTDGLPPLLSMGVRFLVAGLVLGAVLAARGGWARLQVPRRELGGAVTVGLFLLLGGNGLVAVAEQDVPSALAALLVATTPLWLVGFRTATGDRPAAATWVGTAIGFAGVAVLARPGGHDGAVPLAATLLVVLATFLWAVGTFASGRLVMPADPFVASFWQMSVGGTVMAAVGAATGEVPRMAAAFDGGLPVRGLVAWAYLVLVGSLVGYTAYYWVLRNAPISLVATYAYVNPVVAVVLGWAVLAEPVTLTVLLGGGLAVLGVLVVVSRERHGRPPPVVSQPAPQPADDEDSPAPAAAVT